MQLDRAADCYDVPLWTPRLRLNLYGGRSEFDIDGGGGIDFLGNGYFYGGKLRFNAFQEDGWFFDLTTSLSREKSKVTTSLFPQPPLAPFLSHAP